MPTFSPGPVPQPSSVAPVRPTPRSRSERAGLSILVAGVDKEGKGPVEAVVRRAFAARHPEEPWSVSLVRLGTMWSVTLQGPDEGCRSLSFTAEEHRLAEAIGDAIGAPNASPAPETSPSDQAATVPVQERLQCRHCGQAILVSYDAQPEEEKEPAPLACPHCWALNRIEVGAWAAVGGDYRAEKA